jgi:predicted site-specific integrase-resolvase
MVNGSPQDTGQLCPLSSPSAATATGLVPISTLSAHLSVSQNSIRKWADDGLIPSYRVGQFGHRRFSIAEVRRALNQEPNGNEGESHALGSKKLSVYLRVSSFTQRESLLEQRKYVLAYVKDKYGLDESEVLIFQEIKSSFSPRKQLDKLILEIIRGNVSVVVCSYKDRLSRIGPHLSLVDAICEAFGVSLVYINTLTEDPKDNDIASEMLSYMTVLCNRASASKIGRLIKKSISEGGLERLTILVNERIPIKECHKIMEREGFYATNTRGQKTTLSYHVVLQVAKHIEKLKAKTKSNNKHDDTNSFVRFIKSNFKKDASGRMLPKDIYSEYLLWCQSKGYHPINKVWAGRNYPKLGITHTRTLGKDLYHLRKK